MVEVFSDLEHAASAGLALAARRVARTDLWSRKGHRSPAHWLAARAGTTVGEAMRLLETAEVVEQAPAAREAFKNGLSVPKANAAGKAEKADPHNGAALVARTVENEGLSVREIQQDAARIVNAATGDTQAERAAKIRQRRSLRIGSDGDGSSWLHLKGPTVDVARLEAMLKPVTNRIFHEARKEGRRESGGAYAYDALFQLLDRGNSSTSGGDGKQRDRHRNTEVIVRADLRALDRGHLEPGEVCEIAGHGPVAVAEVWDMIDGGAFVAGILTDGTDIQKVQHLGRRPTALQRTVLAWETAGTCVVEGCTNTAVIEIDHVDDWADTHITQIRDLAATCRNCHAKKTYDGYTLGPRLANGGRKLLAPRAPGAGPPHAGTPEAPAPDQPGSADQQGLLDSS
jgi:hypothetical protein